jgi:hypothetical protein
MGSEKLWRAKSKLGTTAKNSYRSSWLYCRSSFSTASCAFDTPGAGRREQAELEFRWVLKYSLF